MNWAVKNQVIWTTIGFQERDGQDSQNLNIDSFCRLPVTSAQCLICTEKYPDAGLLLNYDHDENSQGYSQIEEAFRVLTKDDTLQPCITDVDFRSSNGGAELGYHL